MASPYLCEARVRTRFPGRRREKYLSYFDSLPLRTAVGRDLSGAANAKFGIRIRIQEQPPVRQKAEDTGRKLLLFEHQNRLTGVTAQRKQETDQVQDYFE